MGRPRTLRPQLRRDSLGSMRVNQERDSHLFEPVGRTSQVLVGLLVLGGTVFVAYYSIRDIVWFLTSTRLAYVEPELSAASLALSPWLILVACRLIAGQYNAKALFSPGAFLLLGAGLLIMSAIAAKTGFLYGRGLGGLVLVGSGAMGLGWRRWKRGS